MAKKAISRRNINPLKTLLAKDQAGIGVIVSMPSMHTTQVLANSGFDWLFIDMEHGPIDIDSAYSMITATNGTQCAPIVRVPWNVHWLVKPILDAGAMGIIFPMIRSAEEAAAAAAAVRYPPDGERGFGPFYAPLRFGQTTQAYTASADKNIMCILLIEHKDAIEDIDNIVATKGVDACFIAPFDLAMSYGYRDGPDHPEVQVAIRKAEKAILNSKAHLGGLALENKLAKAMMKRGYQLLLCGFDTLLLQRAADDILSDIRPE